MIKDLKVKLLLALLSLALLTSLTSCSAKYTPIEPTEEDMTVVGQVGGKDVYLDELRFITESNKKALEGKYGEGIFSGEDSERYLEELREAVFANITANYATLQLCDEAYIRLGEQVVIDRVDSTLADIVDELGGMKKYKEYLKENHLTDHFLRFNIEVSLLENELFYVYVDDLGIIESDDDAVFEIIEDEFIVVRHIFVSVSTENAEEKIQKAKSALDGGADFGAVMQEYNEDSDTTANGIYILKGYMNEKYEETAFSLNIGKRSDIVSDESGYYIIERLEMDSMQVLLKLDALKELYQQYTFIAILDEKQKSLEFIPNEAGLAYINSIGK